MKSLGQSSRLPNNYEKIPTQLPLPRQFYLNDTVSVAKRLLGKALCVRNQKDWCVAEITETEAYLGVEDPASHAYRGKTRRNCPMFDAGGTCYVYLSYGVNYCMNVSTRVEGIGEAVLLRAGRPLLGLRKMSKLRRKENPLEFLSGPGKFTQAMGITLLHNGMRFDRVDFKIVDPGISISKIIIGASSRIGISKAKEHHFRFFIRDSEWLSR